MKLETSLRFLFARSAVLQLLTEEDSPSAELLRNEAALLNQQVKEIYLQVRRQGEAPEGGDDLPYELAKFKGEATVLMSGLPLRTPTQEQAIELMDLLKDHQRLVFDLTATKLVHQDWLAVIGHLYELGQHEQKTVRTVGANETIKALAAKYQLELGVDRTN